MKDENFVTHNHPKEETARGVRQEISYACRPRLLRPSKSLPPLICFCPGPPGARDLASFLPTEQGIIEFQLADLDDPSLFPTVEAIAASCANNLGEVQPEGPYQICGYSNGGYVAYEVARLLLLEGKDVSLLALFDTCHPRFKQNWTFSTRIQHAYHYILNRTLKYAHLFMRAQMRGLMATARYWASKRAELMRWRLTRMAFRNLDRPVPKALKSERHDVITMVRTFIPRSYPRRMLLIRTDDEVMRRVSDETVGWNMCVVGGVEVHFIESDHGKMMIDENAAKAAKALLPFLVRDGAISRLEARERG